MSLTLKIQKGGELRRLTLSRSEASFRALQEKIASLFALPSSSSSSSSSPSFALKYLDEDGDLITISTDLELAELLSSPAFSAPSASLRLQVVPLGESPLPFSASASPSPSPSADRLNEPAPSLEDRAEKEQEQEEQEGKAGLFKESQKETEKETPNEPQEEPSKVANEEASAGAEKEAPKKEEEQDEERAPALEELFESLSNLGTHVQQLFEENPQIQQDLEKLSEQLSSFLTTAFSEPPSNAPSSSSPFEFLFRGFPFPGTPFHHRGPQHHLHHRHPFAASFSSNRAPFPFPAHPGFCGASRPACAQPSTSSASSSSSSSSPSPSLGRRCPASSSSPCGSFFQEKRRIIQERLEELESMGFIDRELNLHLLARFRGDLASVVDELEKINAQFAF